MTAMESTLHARWSTGERLRLLGVIGVVVLLHVAGWTLYLSYRNGSAGAASFAGAGSLAYALGVRHAFDADHIAAIDDTTRLMMQRGRRPVGVGFFFAMGHSSVVVVLSLIVAAAAGAATEAGVETFRDVGGQIATVTAMLFLALVAGLNALLLADAGRLWRRWRAGRLDDRSLEVALAGRGLLYRVLGGRARALVRSSWHMFPLGVLMGLGLETASEITLLTLSATTAAAGTLPLLATLSLPLLFTAGMSAFDTCDGVLMARLYSWSYRDPGRKLFFNLTTTAMTVFVAAFVSSVYLAGVLAERSWGSFAASYAALGDHFELLGYAIVALFVLAWAGAYAVWRLAGLDRAADRR